MVLNKTEKEYIGAVLVIGAGVSGIQASLDLANIGFKVYLVEKRTSLGGKMAQIGGKTAAFDSTCLNCLVSDQSSTKYPTNDCSLNIFIPKMVEVNYHENIEVLVYSEVIGVEGVPGNFRVKVLKKAKFVNEERCHGCGDCANICPVSFPNEFELGMTKRKAIDVPFLQAVPLIYTIDKEHCLKLKEDKCGLCKNACKAYAIDFDQKDEIITVQVGAIIVSTGFETIDLDRIKNYGIDFKNVITSLEYERILSAFGPTQGLVIRPSDQKMPKKIAFISCVGSRSVKNGVPYCSNICCMYLAKQSVLTKKSFPDIECIVLKSDIQVFRKGFNEFYEKVKHKYGIQYTESRIGFIEEDPINNDLIITYEDIRNSKQIKLRANLVVLAVALVPTPDAKKLAEILKIDLDNNGFFKEYSHFMPINSTRKGVYICGCARGPKDIPSSVIEGSAAAAKVAEFLASVKGKEIKKKVYKSSEKLVLPLDPPRIGILICTCGMNLKSVFSIFDLIEYSKTLENVVLVETSIFACSRHASEHIKNLIKNNNLNRFIIAACSARLHETAFQDVCREGGLNQFLLELVNIRDQCYWVHSNNPKLALEKAKKLIHMAVAKVKLLEPVKQRRIPVRPVGIVVGGGISGMVAALSIANQGYQCIILEKREKIGADINKFAKFISPLEDPYPFLKNLRLELLKHPNISIYTQHALIEIEGIIGNFKIQAISLKDDKIVDFHASAIIIAIGAKEIKPLGYYCYGISPRVFTQMELINMLNKIDSNPATKALIESSKDIVMIQCVASREIGRRGYCSRTCCFNALINALSLKKMYPDKNIYILYRDIVMPDKYGEELYRNTRNEGITFIRYFPEMPPFVKSEGQKLKIKVYKPGYSAILNADLLILSTPVDVIQENKVFSRILRIPHAESIGGLYMKAHVKVLPLDLNREGIFICGTARGPTILDESIIEALGTAARSATILSKKNLYDYGMIAEIDPTKCIGCGLCIKTCTEDAIIITPKEKLINNELILFEQATIINNLCMGCGKCAAVCPVQAIKAKNFTNSQIIEMIKVITSDK
ncbi:MAG: 4Fe-4S binding protein [Candidatus Helarchaeota archaeon]